MPEDYEGGMKKCADGRVRVYALGQREGSARCAAVDARYLPMPASHIAIFNDLRGPNNSLTMREAAGNLAIGEAFRTIQRGHANLMVAGATGTRILPMQAIHALQTEQMAVTGLSEAGYNCDPAKASRPFDKNRTGMVAGEGAGMVVLEELASAKARGATIYAEVVGLGSAMSGLTCRVSETGTAVSERLPHARGKCDVALARA
jgi:3-oxoacyl-[acyl-carrier-protein] synthase II